MAEDRLLECQGIGMRFGGETALAGVDFTLSRGEVHGVVGSNGAGKSTLMKILAGALPDHSGSIKIEGRPVSLSSPRAALEQGIAMVYQELSGVGQLSVAENLFLGRQLTTAAGTIRWSAMREQSRQFLAEMGIDVDVRKRLDRFPLVIRQMVEIVRGVHSGARILILDEPTSALSPPETRRLFDLIRKLRQREVSIVFISHFIEDVLEISDRVTILRDGRRIETKLARDMDKHYVIHTMLGHGLEGQEIGFEAPVTLPNKRDGDGALSVKSLGKPGLFEEIDLSISSGECLGLYGFVGAGHQEFAHAVAGALRPATGSVFVDGVPLRPGSPHDAVQRGIALVAADRAQTVIRGEPIYKNLTIAHLRRSVGEWLVRGKEVRVAQPLVNRVGCKPAQPRLKAGNLSGGNQQKIVLGKWLLGPVRVLVLEEPTRGMDVGAKEEVMNLVKELKREGAAVLLASTEPELLLAHADRILVFRRGKVHHEFAGTTVSKQDLIRNA
ncbi:MAG: sugar ABC transporter ATP-binding protein [Planctomycetota bacterium]